MGKCGVESNKAGPAGGGPADPLRSECGRDELLRDLSILLSQVFERGTMPAQECQVGSVSEVVSRGQ